MFYWYNQKYSFVCEGTVHFFLKAWVFSKSMLLFSNHLNCICKMSMFWEWWRRQGLGAGCSLIFCFCNQHPAQIWLGTLHSSIQGPHERAENSKGFKTGPISRKPHKMKLPSSPTERDRKMGVPPDQSEFYLENLTLKWAFLKNQVEDFLGLPITCISLSVMHSCSSSACSSLSTFLFSQQGS